MSLLTQLTQELVEISRQLHALSARRAAVMAAVTRLRTGEDEEMVEVRLRLEVEKAA